MDPIKPIEVTEQVPVAVPVPSAPRPELFVVQWWAKDSSLNGGGVWAVNFTRVPRSAEVMATKPASVIFRIPGEAEMGAKAPAPIGKHTPGPWSADNGDSDQWGVFDDNGGAIVYAKCDSPLRSFDEDAANARLIAAAPLMLDALRSASLVLMGCVGTNDENELERAEAIAALRTAIASATGGAG